MDPAEDHEKCGPNRPTAESSCNNAALRRYVFGLALVAVTAKTSSYLRQGCNVVIDSEKPREFHKVYRDGRREPATISHPEAIEFASTAAETFGKGDSRTVPFDKEKAKADVKKKD